LHPTVRWPIGKTKAILTLRLARFADTLFEQLKQISSQKSRTSSDFAERSQKSAVDRRGPVTLHRIHAGRQIWLIDTLSVDERHRPCMQLHRGREAT
jgi:hypothetical protein